MGARFLHGSTEGDSSRSRQLMRIVRKSGHGLLDSTQSLIKAVYVFLHSCSNSPASN